MNKPMVPPALKATCMAAFIEPVCAAAAVRRFARVESHMPRKPMKPERTAPTMKATVRAEPDWAKLRPPLILSVAPTAFSIFSEVKNTIAASGTTIMPIVRNCRVM